MQSLTFVEPFPGGTREVLVPCEDDSGPIDGDPSSNGGQLFGFGGQQVVLPPQC